jgi:hypothetical protein
MIEIVYYIKLMISSEVSPPPLDLPHPFQYISCPGVGPGIAPQEGVDELLGTVVRAPDGLKKDVDVHPLGLEAMVVEGEAEVDEVDLPVLEDHVGGGEVAVDDPARM